jgi:hypothetical protein
MNVKSAFQTSLNFKKNKIEIRVFCKTKRNKKNKLYLKTSQEKSKKNQPKNKENKPI